MHYKTLLFLILICFFSQISIAQVDSIKFGVGGGVTGAVTIYKLYKNQLYKSDGKLIANFDSTAKLKCKDKKYLFKQANSTAQEFPEFTQPYNHYKFIEIYGKNSKKFVWGNPDKLPPNSIQQYYDSLSKIVKTYKFK